MLYGVGVDGVELARIEAALGHNDSFIKKVLTPRELAVAGRLGAKKRVDFVAGRWAAKEAFSKAYGTGFRGLSTLDIEVSNDERGKPYFSKIPFEGRAELSITDTMTEAIAIVALETLAAEDGGKK